MSNIYYVYAYIRSKDSATAKAGTPYYIGKGKNRRAWDKHNHKVNKPKNNSDIIILEKNMDEYDACDKEIRMIRWYGRIDLGTGILRNKTDGGDGLRNLSEATRKIMSEAKLGKSKGPMSDCHKQAIGQANKGHVVTEETRHKLREARKNQDNCVHSEHTKQKISKANSGSNNGMFGKKLSAETKQKIIENRKDYKISEETKKKIGDANKGKRRDKWSEELRAKMMNRPKRKWTEEERINRALNRKPISEETKRKIGEANSGRKLPPVSQETRDKLRVARYRQIERDKLKDEVSKD